MRYLLPHTKEAPIRFPVYKPSLGKQEEAYVIECLRSTWISSKGPFIDTFETQFAAHVGSEYSVSVCNGTAALHLALLSLGIGPGDEVIVPALTYIASVNAITYVGATPVFVDVLETSWQVDPIQLAQCITSKTKAILIVHLYGHPCPMNEIVALCRAHHLFLIEDCAEALGSYYQGQHVGTFGDVATFSFFGNKTITTGEGGMVITDSALIAQRISSLKGQGLSPGKEYFHDLVGYNYRMTNLCAAIGVAQLEKAHVLLGNKQRIAHRYEKMLTDLPLKTHKPIGDVVHSYWMCSILLEDETWRDPLRTVLRQYGVETRPFFYPAHKMPMYLQENVHLPTTDFLSSRGLNLPSYPDLTDGEVDEICSLISSTLHFLRTESLGTIPLSTCHI